MSLVFLFSAPSFAQWNASDLKSGDKVWIRNGQTGTINGIFPNGDLSVLVNYSNQVFKRDDLATPGCFKKKGCTDDKVWLRNGLTGIINGIFPNGDVSVLANYSNQVFKQGDLATVGCFLRLCSGQSVMTKSGASGVVNGFFTDRNVSVLVNYSNQIFDIRDLAYQSSPDYGHNSKHDYRRAVRNGEKVWLANGLSAVVNGVFSNGDISVVVNYTNKTAHRTEIAIEACFRDICSGNTVFTRNGLRGVVQGIYYNGEIAVLINYSIQRWKYEDLAY